MKVGVASPEACGDPASVEIQALACSSGGPKISLRDLRGKHNICVFHSKWLMYAARTHVRGRDTHCLCEFPVNGKVPLHHIAAGWMRLKICLPESIRRSCETREGGHWKGANRQISCIAWFSEWGGIDFVELHQIRKRQHIKDAESRANNGFSIVRWVPCRADTRFDVAQSRIGEQWRA